MYFWQNETEPAATDTVKCQNIVPVDAWRTPRYEPDLIGVHFDDRMFFFVRAAPSARDAG